MILYTASGTVRLPEARVASVADVTAPKPAERLNVEAAEPAAPAASKAAAGRGGEGPAWARVASVADLVRGDDLASAERALRSLAIATPDDAALSVALGEVLVMQSRLSEAASVLGTVPPGKLDPPLQRARALALSDALVRLQRADEADRLLASTPDDARGSIAAARRGLASDVALGERPLGGSEHFVVTLPEGTSALDVSPLLAELERIHAMLKSELGGAPRDRIRVVIYPGNEFWEQTGMTRQVGALYDGTVRVPAGRVAPVSAALSAELRHETAHAFVDAITGGRADMQWQEGVAERYEGTDPRPISRALVAGLRADPAAWPPPVTHATSAARLAWFVGRWGMPGLRDVLAGMASRGTIDAAVRAVTGLSRTELDEAWRHDLLEEKP